MDEDLLRAIEALSLAAADQNPSDQNFRYNHEDNSNPTSTIISSSSSRSSPTSEQTIGNSSEDELQNSVSSLFDDLGLSRNSSTNNADYDRTKFLISVLGNTEFVINAVKKVRELVTIGKKMEQLYRKYYMDPDVALNFNELEDLIQSFLSLYHSEAYIREINVSRVYNAYCDKLLSIYNSKSQGFLLNNEEMKY